MSRNCFGSGPALTSWGRRRWPTPAPFHVPRSEASERAGPFVTRQRLAVVGHDCDGLSDAVLEVHRPPTHGFAQTAAASPAVGLEVLGVRAPHITGIWPMPSTSQAELSKAAMILVTQSGAGCHPRSSLVEGRP